MSRSSVIRRGEVATGAVTTVAGAVDAYNSGHSGNSDGLGKAASFYEPDSTGTHLCVSEGGNGEIRKIDLGTNEVTTLARSSTNGLADGSVELQFSRVSGQLDSRWYIHAQSGNLPRAAPDPDTEQETRQLASR